jgi:hypothetical protein
MRAWIMNKDVPTYNALMHEEGLEPKILETLESKTLTVMSKSVAQLWSTSAYWYEAG